MTSYNKTHRPWMLLFSLALLAGCGGSGSSSNNSGDGANAGNPPGSPTPVPGGNSTPPPASGGSGGSTRQFGSPNDNQIRPGVEVSSADGSCTSNFLYTDGNDNFFIGAVAHCFSPDTNSGIDPCATGNQPLESPITIENAGFSGRLAYSSWRAMQQNGETPGSDICQSNDFALVRIDARDLNNIHPSAIIFGGPTALLEGRAAVGDQTFSFGQSPFHLGVATLQEKQGPITGVSDSGWTYTISYDNPGLPGDSGSAVLHESGEALGALSVVGTCLGLFCSAVSNGVVNLDLALDYANRFMGTNLRVVTWNQFSP